MTESPHMRRRTFTTGALALAAAPYAASAQQQGRVPRIAYLSTNPPRDGVFQDILAGLREFGYVDGVNIVIEDFSAPNIDALPPFAERAVASRPDLLLTNVTPSTLVAKRLTATIPIVFVNAGAPVENGLVASLARPGGNVTGVSNINVQLAAKRLELLREMVPNVRRLAVFVQPEDQAAALQLPEVMSAAKAMGIESAIIEAPAGRPFEPLFESAVSMRSDAIFFVAAAYFLTNAVKLAELTARFRLPALASRPFVDAGGLMSYEADASAIRRRAAYYVDRVLKGTRPADLPVEQPVKFDLVINARAAKALGLEIPMLVEAQATEVIQ